MKTTRVIVLVLLALSTLNPQLSRLHAQGSEFTYNGLLNENGNPLNGLVELEATLWDAATNGNQIISVHPLRQMVEVRKGLFTVVLDFGKEAFSGPPRWLQIALRKDPDPAPFTTLWPRQKITAVPYAVTAEEISGKVPIGGLFGAYTNAVAFDNPGNSFAGRGFDLTHLNASQLTSGTVPTAALGNAWKISGNMGTTPGTHFLGTMDNQPLELKVNSQRALRLEPNPDSPNVIGGFNGNLVRAGDFGSTIGGGGSLSNPNAIYASYATIAGGRNNYIFGSDYGAIGGGLGNEIRTTSFASTISGGVGNDIGTNSLYSAIGGGNHNSIAANALYATIPGGDRNFATNRAFAAGTRAKANHAGAFVWADSQDADFASSANNQFLIRAGGGVGINLANPVHMLHVGTTLGTNAINVSTHRAVVENSAEEGRAALLVLAGPGSSTATNRVELELEANEAQRRAIIGTASNHEIQFRQNNLVRMLLATDGNLYVAGTINGTLASDAVASTQIVDGSVSAADVNAPTFSTTFWKTDGNAGTTPGTHFLGTTDNQPLEIKVNGIRALRLEPVPLGAPNVIGGSSGNSVAAGVVGATIAGGGANSIATNSSGSAIGGGGGNTIAAGSYYSTIAAGHANDIGTNAYWSTIGGGEDNSIATNGFGSTIGGGFLNEIAAHSGWSTIAGGSGHEIRGSQDCSIGGGNQNKIANSRDSTIAGGVANTIGTNSPYSAIGGGGVNGIGINSPGSAIGGGRNNNIAANSPYAVIPGGSNNLAGGAYSFAAGRHAKAYHTGAFVWADSLDADFASTGTNQFLIRAQGGVGIGTSDPEAFLQVTSAGSVTPQLRLEQTENNNFARLRFTSTTKPFWDVAVGSANNVMNFYSFGNGNVMTLTTNGTLTTAGPVNPPSDRNVKTAFEPVNARQILEKVAALPVTTWAYTNAPTVRHVGPVAQDFHAAFGVGTDDKHIATVDADGVALAAIQGLNQKLEEQLQARDSEIRELRQGLAELKETLKNLTTKTQE